MHPDKPSTIRQASRVILLDEHDRVLLFRASEPLTKKSFWIMPGGGVEPGETFEDAASRELLEETGVVALIGPCVWYRQHQFMRNGRESAQYERFFVARTTSSQQLSGSNVDSYILESRWWSLKTLCNSAENFIPQRLRELLPPILRGEFNEVPFDCGV